MIFGMGLDYIPRNYLWELSHTGTTELLDDPASAGVVAFEAIECVGVPIGNESFRGIAIGVSVGFGSRREGAHRRRHR